jgi:4-amino-4-deoxy-L-arabinose transferase-like glycosyltransferase
VNAPRPPLRLPPDLASEPVPSRAGTVLYVVALVLIAVWDLGGRSILHRDLPRFAVIAREMITGGDWLVPQQHGKPYLNKPILFIWMVAGPSALFGDANAVLLRRCRARSRSS